MRMPQRKWPEHVETGPSPSDQSERMMYFQAGPPLFGLKPGKQEGSQRWSSFVLVLES